MNFLKLNSASRILIFFFDFFRCHAQEAQAQEKGQQKVTWFFGGIFLVETVLDMGRSFLNGQQMENAD